MEDKSGKKLTRMLNGYVVVYVPGHPSSMTSDNWNGWIYEHILTAERLIGRRLEKDECVHHLDRDRSNNHPSNLIVILKSQHSKLHRWLDRGAPGCESSCENPLNSGKPKVGEKKQVIGIPKEPKELKHCLSCGNPIVTTANKHYCSSKCSTLASRKVERPSKEELERLIWEIPTTAIANRYGVSDNAVGKWCKSYGIPKPPRGYWQKKLLSKHGNPEASPQT
jgi:predicted nucleic acid-binding Zn ribbon protein